MIMLVLLTGWALYRWSEEKSWRWAVLAGVFGGAAVFVKVIGAFFVGGMALGMVIYTQGRRSDSRSEDQPKGRAARIKAGLFNPQVGVMALLMTAPALIYYLAGSDGQASSYPVNWTILSRWRALWVRCCPRLAAGRCCGDFGAAISSWADVPASYHHA